MGEGFGFEWPGSDWSIVGLALAFLIVSLLVVPVARRLAGGEASRGLTTMGEASTVPVEAEGGQS